MHVAQPPNGDVRLILSKWDKATLVWCIVDIKDDNIALTARRNPPDATNEWRKANPTIIPLVPTPAAADIAPSI